MLTPPMMTTIDTTAPTLPPPFDLQAYRAHNAGLAGMTDEELAFHYEAHGRAEGRVCSLVHDRASLLRLVPDGAKVLEIGPSWSPAFRRPGHDVTYIDTCETAELRRRAEQEAAGQGALVPEIDYVWRGERYGELIRQDFDIVYSCHDIDRQPNLVGHLRDVAAVLRPSGRFLLVIADKRYGYGHFRAASDITHVLEAHAQGRTRHAMASVLTDQMMLAHNEPLPHWLGEHGSDPRFTGPTEQRTEAILKAMAYQDAGEGYVDAHAWHFTPETFGALVTELQAVKLVPLQIARLYPTVHGASEFYAVLHKR